MRRALRMLLALLCLAAGSLAQDSSTAALRGTVRDPSGALIAGAQVTLTDLRTGISHSHQSDREGVFHFADLRPAEYELVVLAEGMAPLHRPHLKLEVGAAAELHLALSLAGAREIVTVAAETPLVETQPAAVSSVIDTRAIAELPLNGRRFTDLALLTPGVTQDPRGLTSSSNGDLAFGGVRGFHSSYLVDGLDNNNGFFAQARGRYRAPYQFSNEVVQEFRVSSNTYGPEQGRSGGAVVNVVTKSGGNQLHGSLFYYLRDGKVSARHRFMEVKPPDRQQQFGFSLGGPIRRNKAFFFAALDQHVFHVPLLVRFVNGSTTITPTPADYEDTDRDLVFAAAERLSRMGGLYQASMTGNSAFLKLDWSVTPRHYLTGRLSTSRYWGENNVFLDPASPVTEYAADSNGEEMVSTESASVSLTSSLSLKASSLLRVQFSRDLQNSNANSAEVRTRIDTLIDAFGRSNILPRRTRERRLHLAETVTLDGRRHSWKFGGDLSLTRVYNFFPMLFGGQYVFDDIRVNPWTFAPWVFGMRITPLRAYAHEVPRYYFQNFGNAESHPDSNEFALFVQDSIRLNDHFAFTLGLRYDLQTFRSDGLVANPLWPGSGTVPSDRDNFAPRAGFAWSIGHEKPVVVRGGFGIFFTRIPQIYTSTVETDNGLAQGHLFLDNADSADRPLFPSYPEPVVRCEPLATTCAAPPTITDRLSTEVAAFSPQFRTPAVQQGSLSVEREFWRRFAVGASYLYVRGRNLIRARDANLAEPTEVVYPVFDPEGDEFTGEFYAVDSFATWQMSPSLACPFPPCLGSPERPVPELGAVNVFETAAESVYHGLTLSARRRMTDGLYFRLAWTWARASDTGQDAIVAGRPAMVQNSAAPDLEWARSVTDQRHRLMLSWIYEPRFFHRDQPLLRTLFNDWRVSGVVTLGSGRPVNARIVGDANRDGNSLNDRLPGYSRNAFTGPDYATTDLRLARRFTLSDRVRLEALAEAFNAFNRTNRRVDLSDDGFLNTAAEFVPMEKKVGGVTYPAHYRASSGFPAATSAYAPRQVQFALKLLF